MNSVNKTLYIPLYGKSYVSKKGLFLKDEKAEEIWEKEGFSLKGKAKSKWLAYYMGIRSAVFDTWLSEEMKKTPDAVVLHIGCGMDSRILRISGAKTWYDVDLAAVIEERKRYFTESDSYQMLAGDVREGKWLCEIPKAERAIIVMEGVSMYLTSEEMRSFAERLCAHFESFVLLADAYTTLAAKLSKKGNPVNEVGVTEVFGIDDPNDYASGEVRFVKEHTMIPQSYIDELHGFERFVFARLYAGGFSKKLYRLFEYEKK